MPNNIETIPIANRSLKALVANLYAYDRAPTPQEYSQVFDMKLGRFFRDGKKVTFEDECERLKLTDSEIDKLETWLAREKADREARIASNNEVLKAFKHVQIGYIKLPCGHQRRRATAFSIGKPDEIVCYYPGCLKRFKLENRMETDTLVELKPPVKK